MWLTTREDACLSSSEGEGLRGDCQVVVVVGGENEGRRSERAVTGCRMSACQALARPGSRTRFGRGNRAETATKTIPDWVLIPMHVTCVIDSPLFSIGVFCWGCCPASVCVDRTPAGSCSVLSEGLSDLAPSFRLSAGAVLPLIIAH